MQGFDLDFLNDDYDVEAAIRAAAERETKEERREREIRERAAAPGATFASVFGELIGSSAAMYHNSALFESNFKQASRPVDRAQAHLAIRRAEAEWAAHDVAKGLKGAPDPKKAKAQAHNAEVFLQTVARIRGEKPGMGLKQLSAHGVLKAPESFREAAEEMAKFATCACVEKTQQRLAEYKTAEKDREAQEEARARFSKNAKKTRERVIGD